ncbi:PEP-CTERM sorting domain-containing protein [Methylophilus sp. 3sh_L]|jgi:hypothetical protein|uniref:PEP-CTERM sorting domain-containing protein n=1 Tax=Methylophilus sp. 3sh_L TaxID=3377114 RepID=UPI00398E3E36
MLSQTRRTRSILSTISFLVLACFHAQAEAALVSYSSNNVDLFYSSISDVTWTKDANLLATMIAESSYSTVVDAIISANTGVSFGSTPHSLTSADFSSVGETSWWGAQAFVHYLNHINYAGSDQWRLPSVTDIGNDGCTWSLSGTDCGYSSFTNGTNAANEFAELYYKELGLEPYGGPRSSYYGISTPFSQVQSFYWTGTEVVNAVDGAFEFFATYGYQEVYTKDSTVWFAWAITPGSIVPVDVPSTVPEPYSAALLTAGIGSLLARARQRRLTVTRRQL